MTVIARRDGGLDKMELNGHLTLRISDDAFGRIKLQIRAPTNNMVQTQTHPNVDKELMRRRSQIALKNPAKPFPLNTDVGVLKWRLQTTDESNIPLSSNVTFLNGKSVSRMKSFFRAVKWFFLSEPFAPQVDLCCPILRGLARVHERCKWITNKKHFRQGKMIS